MINDKTMNIKKGAKAPLGFLVYGRSVEGCASKGYVLTVNSLLQIYRLLI